MKSNPVLLDVPQPLHIFVVKFAQDRPVLPILVPLPFHQPAGSGDLQHVACVVNQRVQEDFLVSLRTQLRILEPFTAVGREASPDRSLLFLIILLDPFYLLFQRSKLPRVRWQLVEKTDFGKLRSGTLIALALKGG